MRILLIADVPDKKYWDFYRDGILNEIDLIVSCGDLPSAYLSFLVTMACCPLIYVKGNHDDSYKDNPPDGCICVENDIFEYNGVRFLGLGGSRRYKPGINQYTEKEMLKRIKKLRFKLLRKKGFDVLLTHSPARGINDAEDVAHHGFYAFYELLDKYSPQYFLHGHVHMNYGYHIPRECTYKDTLIINGYKSQIFEIDEKEIAARRNNKN